MATSVVKKKKKKNLQPFAKTQEVDLIIKCVIALIVHKMFKFRYLTTIISRHGTGDEDNKTSSAERPHCGETVRVWGCSFFTLWQNEDDTEVTVTPRCHSGAIFSQCFLSADMRICLSLNMKLLTCNAGQNSVLCIKILNCLCMTVLSWGFSHWSHEPGPVSCTGNILYLNI